MADEMTPYRELFVERREQECPWCKTPMREIDEDGGVRCDHCGARSLPLEARNRLKSK